MTLRGTAAAAVLAASAAACSPGGGAAVSASADPPFEESDAVAFTHFNGMSGETYFCEIVGSGVALLDADGDGDLDLYAVQGAALDDRAPLVAPPADGPPRGRLFRNDTTTGPDGRRSLRFTDVTAASGIDARGYGMGAAVGDFDGDGRPDLYLTNFGADQLWHNLGDGRFEDVTARAGVAGDGWSTSAAFLDFDRDGRLDLYVCRYEAFTVATNKPCYAASGARDYCGPRSYRPIPDRLFRNRGDGTFEDVSVKSGIAGAESPGLGVVCFDADGDGWTDVFVANDGRESLLWMNQGDGTLRNEALRRGCAVNAQAATTAEMGTDAGDFDEDGDLDVVVANLTGESSTLYVNDGRGRFQDGAARARLAAPSLPTTGFGAAFLDYDGDGRLDLVVANGAVREVERRAGSDDLFPFRQRSQLFHNAGDGRFEDVSERAGAPFSRAEVGRGLAVGDLDDDGDTDVVVTNNSGPLRILVNRVGNRGRWVGLRVEEGVRPRPAYGAVVELTTQSGRRLVRLVHADGSYCSSSDPRVLFGLGPDDGPAAIRVVWPDGATERFDVPATGRYSGILRGTGHDATPARPR